MQQYQLSSAEVREIWQQTCQELTTKVSPAVYNTWVISNSLTIIELVGDAEAICTITSPTAFHSTNVRKNLEGVIVETLTTLLGRQCRLEFKIGTPIHHATPMTSPSPVQPAPLTSPSSTPSFSPQPSHQTATYSQSTSTGTSSLQSAPQYDQTPTPIPPPPSPTTSHFAPPSSSSHRVGNSPNSPRVEDLFSEATIHSATLDRAEVAGRQAGLRRDYTFETFAVSTTNEMAHAAATAVSQRPGTAYNPLFLYGGVGVGKTHLMHAIGNNILNQDATTKIIYCTGEEFTNEIVSAIQTKRAIKFKEKYRTAQVLLIDDVQFIAGKNAVQEEFFHTFNALTQQARQVVLTSDRPPHEINLLEDRLRSRFEAGLMIDIQQPSFELRTAILLIKAKAQHLMIPMDIAQLIASKVDSARKIEGVLKNLRSAVELQKKTISAELVESLLMSEVETHRKQLKVQPGDILRAVANHYRVKQTALKGKRRVAQLVTARHVAMYLLKEDLRLPLTEIGKWFSNRDHTTALHGIRKIEQQLTIDSLLQRDVSALRMSLTAISK